MNLPRGHLELRNELLRELYAVAQALSPSERVRIFRDTEAFLDVLSPLALSHMHTMSVGDRISLVLEWSEAKFPEKAGPEAPRPPRNYELLLHLFLPRDQCEFIVGDLEERYHKIVARLEVRRARWWYRKQVFTSLWPLFRAALRRLKTGLVVGAFSLLLRVTGHSDLAVQLVTASRTQLGKRGGRRS